MKKVFLMTAISLAFYSCGKKSNSAPAKNITGKWNHTKDVVKHYSNAVYQFTDIANFDPTQDYIQFNANSTGTIRERNTDGTGYDLTDFQYILSGSNLTLTTGDAIESATITQLRGNSIIIHDEISSGNTKDVIDSYYSK